MSFLNNSAASDFDVGYGFGVAADLVLPGVYGEVYMSYKDFGIHLNLSSTLWANKSSVIFSKETELYDKRVNLLLLGGELDEGFILDVYEKNKFYGLGFELEKGNKQETIIQIYLVKVEEDEDSVLVGGMYGFRY